MRSVPLNLAPDNMSLMMRRQRMNRANPTPEESHVKGLLEALGERYIFEKGFLTRYRFFLVDFYLPRPRRLCIEIDGEYHDRQKYADAVRDKFLREERGMCVLRIRNETALGLGPHALLELIEESCARVSTTTTT